MVDGQQTRARAPSDAPRPGPRGPDRPGRAPRVGTSSLPVVPQGGPPFDRRLDDLERHRGFDVAARLDRARRLEAEAEAAGDVPSVMRARLVMADMLHRSGDPTAMRLAVQVNDWATTHGARPLIARSHLVLSGMFYQVGDPAASLDHAVRAMDLLDDDTPPRVRGNHLLQLGDALSIIGSTDEARQRYHEAEAEFAKLDDPERQVHVLNNLAVLEQESGHIDAALEVVERLTERVGSDISYPEVADTIARVQLAAGDLEAAERTVAWGDRLVAEQGGGSRHVMAWLALAGVEIRIAQGRLDEAVADLDRCLEICAARNLAGVRVQALQVRANLLAARGDFEGAFRTHQTFYAEYVLLRSSQQEAAARTRQALYETAEARREAQRFWLQARIDPLTELYNRRFVDEELPRYLDEVTARGGCVAVAIVDADHFKHVNDRFSHAVGDQVLRRLAALVTTALQPASRQDGDGGDHRDFAARIGGEEFLAVAVRPVAEDAPAGALAAVTADTVRRLSSIRADVADRSWHELAAGLTVTVSAGIAVARPTDTPSTLLARADNALYRAKQRGRDRVVADSPTPSGGC